MRRTIINKINRIKIINKKIIKSFSLLLFFFFLFLNLAGKAQAEEKIKVYFFWASGCPHCAREKIFLEGLVERHPQVEVASLDTSKPENIELWREAGKRLQTNIGPTPFTVVGDHYFIGYLNDQTTGKEIEAVIDHILKDGCPDILKDKVDPEACQPESKNVMETINLPLLGEIKTRDISLPFLTIIMGVLDGFNPCAMWTLLFLISLLLGMKDRKRMWILGIAFIITSAFVYFLFMAAWLNFFLLLGFIIWVRIIIGLIALGAGGYSLRDWWKNKDGGCKVVKSEKRRKVFERIKEITQKKSFILALMGIVLLAFAVNLVELVCSAGLPAVYTQVLSMNSLTTWQYYLYLIGYVFFFMIDDLFVFFTAMVTLRAVGIENKYARFSRLIGGIIMVLIGALLLFKPEWLMFG